MKCRYLAATAALALTSALALAQDAPESLLPPSLERPRASAPEPAATGPVVQPLPGQGASSAVPGASAPADRQITLPSGVKLPPLGELQRMSADQLVEALDIKPKSDIPASARRAMQRVGVLDITEGGLSPDQLTGQPASLVAAALDGNRGLLVSRWGHILLRRALISRMDAPVGMNPADFAAMRAALLVRMGEGEAARALVQDVDTGNYTPRLTQAAIEAYVATADFTGACPAVTLQGGLRKDPQWDVLRAICASFQGESQSAMTQLDRMVWRAAMPKIDLLLAQKYAGAAGKSRRAVKIEWDEVEDMTPWRYAMTLAGGLEPPAALLTDRPMRYDLMAATAPMLGLTRRAAAADRAGGLGVLSSAAMVDLYSQIYALDDDADADWAAQAEQLRLAYVARSPDARISAMRSLWDGGETPLQRYSRQVLTAYAAARLPVNADLADESAPLIASMLAAGLDRNAARWAPVVETGTEAWALLAVAAPNRARLVEESAINSFIDDDSSESQRKSAFLLAGLAGLGRVSPDAARRLADRLEISYLRQTRWSRLIRQAAQVRNPALVALLAGLGMQGLGWDKMTPRHLYHIVGALREAGLEAEARMIAAEAVARG